MTRRTHKQQAASCMNFDDLVALDCCPLATHALPINLNVAALAIGGGFGGPLDYSYNKEPRKWYRY